MYIIELSADFILGKDYKDLSFNSKGKMSHLTLDEYIKLLEEAHYNFKPDELKELTGRLCKNRNDLVERLKEHLILQEYDASIYDDSEDNPVIDVYLGFSGLKFKINAKNQLVLIEEMWYDRGCVSESCKVKIGEPSTENIIKIITMYINDGRASDNYGPSIMELLTLQKSN